MRKIFLGILAVSMMLVSCSKDDDNDSDEPKKIEEEEVKLPMPEIVHEAVDLGLPSGIKWASMNIGAASESEIGYFFAWGETVGFGTSAADGRPFFLSDYKWNDASAGYTLWYGFTKYQIADGADGQIICDASGQTVYETDAETGEVKKDEEGNPVPSKNPASLWYQDGKFVGDNKTILDDVDDAAQVLWGNGWRMPTGAEVKELCDNCTSEWAVVDGVRGKLMKSKINGNSIFLPAGGDRGQKEAHWRGEQGYYWASTLKSTVTEDGVGASTGFADMLWFSEENVEKKQAETEPLAHYARRFGGRNIRPVRK